MPEKIKFIIDIMECQYEQEEITYKTLEVPTQKSSFSRSDG